MVQNTFSQINPSTGNGSSNVNATALRNNTGRTNRSDYYVLQATGCADITLEVEQEGRPSFFDLPASYTVPKEGGYYRIDCKANATGIQFTFETTQRNSIIEQEGAYSNSYMYSTTNDGTDQSYSSVSNGTAITGDPGATNEYNLRVTNLNGGSQIPSNPGTATRQLGVLTVVGLSTSTTKTCTIYQAGGDPTLSVSPAEITLPWNAGTAGSTDTFTVTSNTNWTVS